jgi:hypothetical protein
VGGGVPARARARPARLRRATSTRTSCFEDVGDHGTTDARGFLLLPDASKVRRGDRLTISARLDPLFGLVVADGKKPVVTIELKPDDAIRVQILAADGTPQPGLVAAFGMRRQSLRQSRRGRTEGKDGIATIRGLTAFTQMFSGGKEAEWGVSAVVPLRSGSFVPVDLAAIPADPVVVRLPACGRMSIALQRRDGTPLARKARLSVNPYPRLDPTHPSAHVVSLCEVLHRRAGRRRRATVRRLRADPPRRRRGRPRRRGPRGARRRLDRRAGRPHARRRLPDP